MTFTFSIEICSRALQPFNQKHFAGEIWVWLGQGERTDGPDKDLIYSSAISYTLNPWFMDIAQPLPKETLLVKYEPD